MLKREVYRSAVKRDRLPETLQGTFETIVTQQDNRRIYQINEDRFASVTTFLGETGDKSWLESWKKWIGEVKAVETVNRATTRGTHLHAAIEDFLNDKEVFAGRLPHNTAACFRGIVPLLERIGAIWLAEDVLYSKTLSLAGRVDLVAEFDGVMSVIDFKGATKMKSKEMIEDYFLQCSIYSYLIEDMYKVSIPRIVILMADEQSKSMAFVGDRIHYRGILKQRLEAWKKNSN